MSYYIGLILILFIVIVYYFIYNENFKGVFDYSIEKDPFIHLYEHYNNEGLVFSFDPQTPEPENNYLRMDFKGTVKSIDINLPMKNDNLDSIRFVKIWAVNPESNLSSSENYGIYNTYTEPDFAKKANDVKYKLILDQKPGSRIRMNLIDPANRWFIFART